MTYEEYKTLIKAKFDEVQEKASFDIEGYKTITGFSQNVSYNSVTAHVVLTLCGEIQTILEQIKGYADGIIDKIREEAKQAKQEERERIQRIWSNNNKKEKEQQE